MYIYISHVLTQFHRFRLNRFVAGKSARKKKIDSPSTNKTDVWLQSGPSPTDWQTALPHMHASVIPADCRVSCHAATRWLGMRATADWRCSREVDRVTPGERRVGGKQMCVQCTVNEHRWCIYWHLRRHSGWHSTAAQSKPTHSSLGRWHTHLYTGE